MKKFESKETKIYFLIRIDCNLSRLFEVRQEIEEAKKSKKAKEEFLKNHSRVSKEVAEKEVKSNVVVEYDTKTKILREL